MEDFAAPNIPSITVRPPTDLPNQHHEAIVSASGNPTVPPRSSSVLSMARPPVIPPRGSSIKLRSLLEQTPRIREKLASMPQSIQQALDRGGGGQSSSGNNNNRVRFQGVNEGGGGGGGGEGSGSSNVDWNTFAAGSSHRLNIAEGMERTESLRPFPDLTVPTYNIKDNNITHHVRDNSSGGVGDGGRCTSSASTTSGGRSMMSRTSSEQKKRSPRKRRDKGKGKARAAGSGRSIASSGCADDDEEILMPMLPLHYMESADMSEPRTPIAPMPSSGLHFPPRSEPRSEDGVPVSPR